MVEGVREAQDYKPPPPIINGILEHHGTCKIGMFYEKSARAESEIEIPETEFAIQVPNRNAQKPPYHLDASESGVRSLENPTLETVRKFVGKIIRARSDDNQFEDCNLTLRQLTQIRDVVARALFNTMHTRVAYAMPSDSSKNGTPEGEK